MRKLFWIIAAAGLSLLQWATAFAGIDTSPGRGGW